MFHTQLDRHLHSGHDMSLLLGGNFTRSLVREQAQPWDALFGQSPSSTSASGKHRRAFLHKSRAALVIIGTIKTGLDGALDRREIAFGLRFEEFRTGQFRRPNGE